MTLLSKHRHGLELLAKALLEKETVDGKEVARLVDEANGGPVHAPEAGKFVPRITYKVAEATPAKRNGDTAKPPTPEDNTEVIPEPSARATGSEG